MANKRENYYFGGILQAIADFFEIKSGSYKVTFKTATLTANREVTLPDANVSIGIGGGTVNAGTQNRIAYYATTTNAVSEAAAITANRVLVSDANGVPTHSSVTNTTISNGKQKRELLLRGSTASDCRFL